MNRTARTIPFVATALAAVLALLSPARRVRPGSRRCAACASDLGAGRRACAVGAARGHSLPRRERLRRARLDRVRRRFSAPCPAPCAVHAPPQVVYYYPVPVGYPVYQQGAYGGGGVYDTNGRPLSSGFDAPVVRQYEGPLGTPDLSGVPYVAVEGGTMLVDFGDGDRRTLASCAAVAAAQAPDGRSRTVFYRPPADALVLRPGQRGRVLGAPPAGAWSCYQLDPYGRTVLSY